MSLISTANLAALGGYKDPQEALKRYVRTALHSILFLAVAGLVLVPLIGSHVSMSPFILAVWRVECVLNERWPYLAPIHGGVNQSAKSYLSNCPCTYMVFINQPRLFRLAAPPGRSAVVHATYCR